MRPRLLDLFAGAGGSARGYQLAGFDVVGVDIAPQPNYPGDDFVQADIAAWADEGYPPFIRGLDLERDFDAVSASPPCQAYTPLSNRWRGAGGVADSHPTLIGQTRALLVATGLPYVLENVMGARRYMDSPVKLCGRTVGLPIHRHRLFETNWPLMAARCVGGRDPFGIYGKLDGRRLWTRPDGTIYRAARTLEEAREAMGMSWADWGGIREAVPPAMTEMIGTQLMQRVLLAAGASR